MASAHELRLTEELTETLKKTSRLKEETQRVNSLAEKQAHAWRTLNPDSFSQQNGELQGEHQQSVAKRSMQAVIALKTEIRALHKLEIHESQNREEYSAEDAQRQLEHSLSQFDVGPREETKGCEEWLEMLLQLLATRKQLSVGLSGRALLQRREFEAAIGCAPINKATEEHDDSRIFGADEVLFEARLYESLSATQQLLVSLFETRPDSIKRARDAAPLLEVMAQVHQQPIANVEGLRTENDALQQNASCEQMASAEHSKPESTRGRTDLAIKRLTNRCSELERDNANLLSEKGRLGDMVRSLQAQVYDAQHEAQDHIAQLGPRVARAEVETAELIQRARKATLDVSLIADVVRQKLKQATELEDQLDSLQNRDKDLAMRLEASEDAVAKLERLAERRQRIALVAVNARDQINQARRYSEAQLKAALTQRSMAIDRSEALLAISGAKDIAALRLKKDCNAKLTNQDQLRSTIDDLQRQARMRENDFLALNRRFAAVYADGMTAERRAELSEVRSKLDVAAQHILKLESTNKALESRIFELELETDFGSLDQAHAKGRSVLPASTSSTIQLSPAALYSSRNESQETQTAPAKDYAPLSGNE